MLDLDAVQPLDCLAVIVDSSDVLLNILRGVTSATTATAALSVTPETLEWCVFERLQYGNLAVNLSNRILIVRDVKLNLRNEVFKARFFCGIGIFRPLKATAR